MAISNSLNKKTIFAWAMYDFGNSAFATTILSVVFSVYFARVLVPPEGVLLFGTRVPGESLWGYLVSTVMLWVVVLSPMLGALADRRRWKRGMLAFWALLGSIATTFLFFATPGRLPFGLILSFIAILGFEIGLVFYNAFLNDISDQKTAGRVSGFGFALGYIGGGLCLGLNLAMISKPEWFGLKSDDVTLPVRASVAVAGLWWLLFSIPSLIAMRDRLEASTDSAPVRWTTTLKNIFRERRVRRFLLAYLIYDDGVQTILLMAAIFGAKALGMTTASLSLCYLMIQFVAFVGALFWGRIADRRGHKSVVLFTLAVFGAVTVWGVFLRHTWEFWVLGAVVGFVMGGCQAASRSFFSLMIPPDKTAEYFSVFSIVGKAAALVGPAVFGLASQFFGIRVGVGSLLIFFVVGGIVLLTVDEIRYNSGS